MVLTEFFLLSCPWMQACSKSGQWGISLHLFTMDRCSVREMYVQCAGRPPQEAQLQQFPYIPDRISTMLPLLWIECLTPLEWAMTSMITSWSIASTGCGRATAVTSPRCRSSAVSTRNVFSFCLSWASISCSCAWIHGGVLGYQSMTLISVAHLLGCEESLSRLPAYCATLLSQVIARYYRGERGYGVFQLQAALFTSCLREGNVRLHQ
jgi:hypothetical protein